MNKILESLKQHGAFFAPATPTGQITILNMNLQKIRAAMLPNEFIKFYQICGGIKLGNGYIFGPNEFKTGRTHPIPNLLQINQELTNMPAMRGKTVFGRNMFAVGSNQEAARVCGINVFKTIIGVFVLAGIMYALTGFIEGARIGSVASYTGQNYEGDAIAACVIGGVSFVGGTG